MNHSKLKMAWSCNISKVYISQESWQRWYALPVRSDTDGCEVCWPNRSMKTSSVEKRAQSHLHNGVKWSTPLRRIDFLKNKEISFQYHVTLLKTLWNEVNDPRASCGVHTWITGSFSCDWYGPLHAQKPLRVERHSLVLLSEWQGMGVGKGRKRFVSFLLFCCLCIGSVRGHDGDEGNRKND